MAAVVPAGQDPPLGLASPGARPDRVAVHAGSPTPAGTALAGTRSAGTGLVTTARAITTAARRAVARRCVTRRATSGTSLTGPAAGRAPGSRSGSTPMA